VTVAYLKTRHMELEKIT